MESQDYRTTTHFLPLPHLTGNVRCLNGSAHLKKTEDPAKVTCDLCKSAETYKEYWNEKTNPKK